MKDYIFRNLVFEGGGVKGITYGGALYELEQKGILKNIKRVAGTSAGAITAVLLAVGYTTAEVSDIVAKTNFTDFADDTPGIYTDIRRLKNNYGWHKGDAFKRWIGNLIKKKKGKANLKFKDLQESENSMELYLTTTNLSKQVSDVFSFEHTPDVEIRLAARMSMSIPLYFQCVRFDNVKKDVMVDGGVAWNYPLNIFDNVKYLYDIKNGEKKGYSDAPGYIFNHETLGFRLDSYREIQFNRKNWSNVPENIKVFKDYALALVGFMQEMANKRHLHQTDWNRTIFIDTLDVMTTNFNIPKDKIDELIESGKRGVNTYFKWYDEDVKRKCRTGYEE
jgi:NTE family protein